MVAALVTVALSTHPILANPSDEEVAGALVLLGAAALMHNSQHYREGQPPKGANETADFERGYRDGLHNAEYNSARSSAAYGNGFDAGHKERANHLAYRNRPESDGPNAPTIVMQGCARAIAKEKSVGEHHVHVVRTVQRGPNDFLVEGAVGHSHMSCAMNGNGKVVDIFSGKIQ